MRLILFVPFSVWLAHSLRFLARPSSSSVVLHYISLSRLSDVHAFPHYFVGFFVPAVFVSTLSRVIWNYVCSLCMCTTWKCSAFNFSSSNFSYVAVFFVSLLFIRCCVLAVADAAALSIVVVVIVNAWCAPSDTVLFFLYFLLHILVYAVIWGVLGFRMMRYERICASAISLEAFR